MENVNLNVNTPNIDPNSFYHARNRTEKISGKKAYK